MSRKKEKIIYDKEKYQRPDIVQSRYRSYSKKACSYNTVTEIDKISYGGLGMSGYIKYKIHKCKPYSTVLPCERVTNFAQVVPLSFYDQTEIAKKFCSGVLVPSSYWSRTLSGPFHTFVFDPNSYRLPDIPDLSLSHREALNFFASGCQPLESNWFVGAIEFGDTIDMLKNIGKYGLRLYELYRTGRYPRSWRRYISDLSNGSLKRDWRLSGDAANIYLQYSFAIKPLIADIISLCSQISSLNERINWFKSNNLKPVPVRFEKDLSEQFPLTNVSYPAVKQGVDSGAGVARTSYKAKYCAFALATYDVSGMPNTEIGAKLLSKSLGFRDPLTFLWERIPFSFVLDWVVNVGDYLASFDKPILFPYVLAMAGYSISVTQTNTHYAWGSNTAVTPTYAYKGITGTDTLTYYLRQPNIPVTYSGLEVSLPTLSQLSLALALGRSFFQK